MAIIALILIVANILVLIVGIRISKQKASRITVPRGVVLLVLGLITWLWVRGHSPHMGLGEMMANMDNWILKEPVYSMVVVTAALLALFGVIQLYRGLQTEQNADSSAGNNAHIFCSECGTKCPSNTAFCNKCGSKIGGA